MNTSYCRSVAYKTGGVALLPHGRFFGVPGVLDTGHLGVALHLSERPGLTPDLAVDGLSGVRPGAVFAGDVDAGGGFEVCVFLFCFHELDS